MLLVGFTVFRPMFPNYDTYYALIWGNEMAHFQLPDYDVFKTPTPHPLFNVYTMLLSPLGGAAIPVLTVFSLAMYVGLLYGAYRLVKAQVGTLVGFVTVLVLLTRTDLMAFAFRSMLDIPFLLMIVWAAVLEVWKPRRGLAPLILLALAGLLRPEAWLMAGLYWLWLAFGWVKPKVALPGERPTLPALIGYGFLVVSAPVIWLAWDWVVTGDALYSIHSTSEVAKEVNRQKSLPEAIAALPGFIGGSEKFVNAISGVAGFALAFWAYRKHMLMLAVLGAVGVVTYLLIAVAGLSVIPRYLVVPSLVVCFGVAFSLVGWERLSGTARKVGIGLAIATLLLMAVRAPAYLDQLRGLNTSTEQISISYSRVIDILNKPKVAAQIKLCKPINAFTHESVPIIRYELRASKQDVPATTQLDAPPTRGIQLLQTSALDPLQMTVVTRTTRKPWTGFRQPNFTFLGENRAWIAYSSCKAAH
ncbi:MAG: hypothetical protein QM648_07810 [Solirubrobacterales bacterium]